VIVVDGIAKSFGRVPAVRQVSFTAAAGEVTGLLGPNGAGKTTTLRMLSGLLAPERGRVTVDGIDVHRSPRQARSRLGVLQEVVGLYDRLTVREHLRYAGALHGQSGTALSAGMDALIARFGLSEIEHRRAAALSLGQRRRVALARVLVHQPANVVVDEPTNGLDVLGVRAVRAELRHLASEGCAVIVSTHVMQEIRAVCDRIVVLARGAVVAMGSPDEIQARSGAASLEDAFVATIGSAEGLQS
jgi:sodium transport system ATP-binding protein